MSQQSVTKDERFMICLYEQGLQAGDIYKEFNRYDIGQLAGIQARGVNAICNLLVQANFIKKQGKEDIYLTPHGEKLVLNLIEGKSGR